MPRTPGGLPAILASTRWTMFSPSSWSPPEIHILVPKSRKLPSSAGSARVVMSASDEPACGSERHIVPWNRPSTIGRTYASTCSSEPWARSRLALPTVSIAYDQVPMPAAWNHAKQAVWTTCGSCRPPTRSSMPPPISPASATVSSAAFTSAGRRTRPSTNWGSAASESLLYGANRSAAISAHRSSTASKVSRECSA